MSVNNSSNLDFGGRGHSLFLISVICNSLSLFFFALRVVSRLFYGSGLWYDDGAIFLSEVRKSRASPDGLLLIVLLV